MIEGPRPAPGRERHVHNTDLWTRALPDDTHHALLGNLGEHTEDHPPMAFRALLLRLHSGPASVFTDLRPHAGSDGSHIAAEFLPEFARREPAKPVVGLRGRSRLQRGQR